MNFEKLNTIAKVHHYKKKGYPNTKISRMVGLHRNTVSAYLKKNPEDSIPWLESQETRSKKLDPFKETIVGWLNEREACKSPLN